MSKSGPARETFELVLPFDAAILGELPKEGTSLGFHPQGRQVKAIAEALSEASGTLVTGPSVAGRMGVLAQLGLAVPVTVQPVGQGKGYQATEKGIKLAREYGYYKEENK